MQTRYECYRSDLSINIENGKIIIEGMNWNKYLYLIFEVGNKCQAPFKRENIEATITKITEEKVYVIFDCNQKKKTLLLNDFIRINKLTETVIRFEKNGIGPYQSPEKSQELLDLIQKHKDLDSIQRHQPGPITCWKVYSLPQDFKYAFSDYDQMSYWFTLEEISIISRAGFELKILQKGRDYSDSIRSMSQVAISPLPDAYKRLHEKQYKDNIHSYSYSY